MNTQMFFMTQLVSYSIRNITYAQLYGRTIFYKLGNIFTNGSIQIGIRRQLNIGNRPIGFYYCSYFRNMNLSFAKGSWEVRINLQKNHSSFINKISFINGTYRQGHEAMMIHWRSCSQNHRATI